MARPRKKEPPTTSEAGKLDPWWTPIRDAAFAALMAGVKVGTVAAEAGVDPRSLYEWRKNPLWLAREAETAEFLRIYHEAKLRLTDDAALDAMPGHVKTDPGVCLEHLHRRGILSKPAEKSEVTGANGGPVMFVIPSRKAAGS